MILFQLDKGAIENIDERLKESLSIYLKRKEKLQFLKKALYFAPTLGQFTRDYTQTVKRAADNKRRYAPGEGCIPPVLLSGVSNGVPPVAHDFACTV